MKIARGFLLLICQFWLSCYLPVAAMTYAPAWYEFNCRFHERCDELGSPRTEQRVDDLVRFWRHDDDLDSIEWTRKERFHLTEARQWFDGALGLAAVLFAIYAFSFSRPMVARLSLGLMCCCVGLVTVVPLFTGFWKGTFHHWLFDNESWRNTPFDISYYLMPDRFFVISFATMLAAAFLINTAVYLSCKYAAGNR